MSQKIGKRIAIARERKNLSQTALAEKLNVHRQIVSYWENGNRTPNTEQIVNLSKILDVSSDYLLGLTDACTNKKDLQFICDYTGLNEESIQYLNQFIDPNRKNSDVFLHIMDIFINDFIKENSTLISAYFLNTYSFISSNSLNLYDKFELLNIISMIEVQQFKLEKEFSKFINYDKINKALKNAENRLEQLDLKELKEIESLKNEINDTKNSNVKDTL